MKRRGFSLIELLVVTAILAFLILGAIITYVLQVKRGQDARRKSDLGGLKVVLEDYYNDKNCYPPVSALTNCGGQDLTPYMPRVPCDPLTKQPYAYYRDSSCRWYGLFATLIDTADPIIRELACFPNCGISGKTYNYGVTNGGMSLPDVVTAINEGGTNIESGGGGNESGAYACDSSGQCNIYSDPAAAGCPATYANVSICQQACSDPANRCRQ